MSEHEHTSENASHANEHDTMGKITREVILRNARAYLANFDALPSAQQGEMSPFGFRRHLMNLLALADPQDAQEPTATSASKRQTPETAPRDIGEVIARVLEVAPDLKPHFASLLESLAYAAPETHSSYFVGAANILNHYAHDHPKSEEIALIFNGPANALAGMAPIGR